MLFFGIISSIISIFWLFQMLGTLIYNNGQPIYHFIDDWLNSLAVSSVGFIGVLLYGIFVLYLQACLVKGNTVFGLRIPFIVKFHPM